MKQRIWITIATYIAYCINKELYKAIEYLKVQVEVLIQQQEKHNKRILLTTLLFPCFPRYPSKAKIFIPCITIPSNFVQNGSGRENWSQIYLKHSPSEAHLSRLREKNEIGLLLSQKGK